MQLSIYIHIPFCIQKCRYCNFNSFDNLEYLIPRYINSLLNEIRSYSGMISSSSIKSIYFGGGTPSLLPTEYVQSILTELSTFSSIEFAEITLEVNPGTIDYQKLYSLHTIGVSRLSLGAQSFRDTELKMLGRLHNTDDISFAFKAAHRAGFRNINLDLIYGLPRQSFQDWQFNLEKAIQLTPEHLSLYALHLEDDVPLSDDIASGLLPEPDEDTSADMYVLAEELLQKTGYEHYELSNWAKSGHECQHNLTYWLNEEYLGLGAGAHSYVHRQRFWNVANPVKYIQQIENALSPIEYREDISSELCKSETLILGLRLIKGVELKKIQDSFGLTADNWQTINELSEYGLLEIKDNVIKLSQRGRLLGNEVFQRFLPVN